MTIRTYCLRLSWALAAALPLACTTTEQSAETAAPSGARAVQTDEERRAAYNSGGQSSAVPDATPNRMRLGEQAADINRRKRIENVNTNDPNNTTPETRLRRLDYGAPLPDTSRRP